MNSQNKSCSCSGTKSSNCGCGCGSGKCTCTSGCGCGSSKGLQGSGPQQKLGSSDKNGQGFQKQGLGDKSSKNNGNY